MNIGVGTKKKKLTDKELIERYKSSGNSYYAGELFYRYTHLITALTYKYIKSPTETEDIVMEIFEILLKDLKQYEIKNFSPWLYTVTKNHCLKKKRGATFHMIGDDNIEKYDKEFVEFDPGLSLTDESEKEEKLGKLDEAVKSLTKEQKECIELFYLQEKSYKEVADETGYSMKQVKSFIQNGKRNIKGILNKVSCLIIFIIKFSLLTIVFHWIR